MGDIAECSYDDKFIAHALERLIARAFSWGHDCCVDDIHDRETVGDSYNEGQRDEALTAAQEIREAFYGLRTRLETVRVSRERTRAALEKMRAKADDPPSPAHARRERDD